MHSKFTKNFKLESCFVIDQEPHAAPEPFLGQPWSILLNRVLKPQSLNNLLCGPINNPQLQLVA